MDAAFDRSIAPRGTVWLIAKIIAVVLAGFLTGACLGYGAIQAYDALRTEEPIMYNYR